MYELTPLKSITLQNSASRSSCDRINGLNRMDLESHERYVKVTRNRSDAQERAMAIPEGGNNIIASLYSASQLMTQGYFLTLMVQGGGTLCPHFFRTPVSP